MKTLTKKRRFLAALTAALLISAALVASCMNLLEEQDGKIVIPEGKGVIRLKMGKINRTIYPTLDDPADLYYTIQFTNSSNVTTDWPDNDDPTIRANSTMATAPISLSADTYDIVITAYIAATGGTPVAGWTGNEAVSTGVSTPVTVNLQGWTGSGTGSFQYSITIPAAPLGWALTSVPTDYAAYLEVKNISTNTIIGDGDANPIELNVGLNTNANLTNTAAFTAISAGYYTVKVTLTATSCQDRVIENVLHIYNGKPSTYTLDVPAINQDKFTVKFNLNGHPADAADNTYLVDMSGGGGVNYTGRGMQGNLENAATNVLDPGTPSTDDLYTFDGWYTEDSGGTKWTFGTSRVFQDTNLYAHWTAVSAGPGPEFTFTFIISDASIVSSSNNADPITWNNIVNNSKTLTFTLDSTGISWSGISWSIDGTAIPGATTTTATISSALGSTLLDKFLVKGDHVLSVKATKDGQPYAAYITFRVNN